MVPKFTTKEVKPHETLGEKFKKARLEVKATLDDVEKVIKVRKKHLKALETGDYKNLPANVYTQGFIKKYAQVLGLNTDDCLKLYKKEMGIEENIRKVGKGSVKVKSISSPKLIITPKAIVVTIIIAAVLATIGYIGYQFSSFSAPPSLKITEPAEEKITVSSPTTKIAGKTDDGAEIEINNQPVAINPDGSFEITVSLQSGINYIKVIAKAKNGKASEQTKTIVADIPKAEEIVSQTPEQTQEKVVLAVEIGPDSSWLKIVADDKTAYEGVMLPGIIQTFTGQEKIILSCGNAGSVSVSLGGNDLGTLGKKGERKKDVIFDKNTKVIE